MSDKNMITHEMCPIELDVPDKNENKIYYKCLIAEADSLITLTVNITQNFNGYYL